MLFRRASHLPPTRAGVTVSVLLDFQSSCSKLIIFRVLFLVSLKARASHPEHFDEELLCFEERKSSNIRFVLLVACNTETNQVRSNDLC